MNLNEAFSLIAELAIATGDVPITKFDNCWEIRIDDRWSVAVNGHGDDRPCSFGVAVPPCSAYVQFNGWPAGIIRPYGGVMAAGSVANEDALIEALKVRLAQAQAAA